MFFFISAAFFATHFKASWEISFDKSLIGVPRLLGANSLAIFNAPPNMLSVAFRPYFASVALIPTAVRALLVAYFAAWFIGTLPAFYGLTEFNIPLLKVLSKFFCLMIFFAPKTIRNHGVIFLDICKFFIFTSTYFAGLQYILKIVILKNLSNC